MSSISHDRLIDAIHATPHKGVVYTTGGGVGAIHRLMRPQIGGASATVLHTGTPHGNLAVPWLLGLDLGRPDRFPKAVSPEVARGLAMSAYIHASRLRDGTYPVFGVGCTASLKKQGDERPDRVHRFIAAVHTDDGTTEMAFEFARHLSRGEEESMVASAILDLVASACGIDDRCFHDPASYGHATRQTHTSTTCNHGELPDLIAGRKPYIAYRFATSPRPTYPNPDGQLILSSSLNPMHDGHDLMAKVASEEIGRPCLLEMTIRNAAKPPLDYITIHDRLRAIRDRNFDGTLILSNLGTFVEKSAAFRNSTFVIGHDTAVRIPDPRYYGGGIAERDFMYDQLRRNGARFLVFGRVDATGAFQNIEPEDPKCFPDEATFGFFRRNSSVVPESRFRQDISSTNLRMGDK